MNFKHLFTIKWSLVSSNLISEIVLRNGFNYVILKKRSFRYWIHIYSILGFKLVMSERVMFGFSSFSDVFDFFAPYFGKLSFAEPLTWYWFWAKTFDSLFFLTSAILLCEFSACFSSESIIRCKVFKYGVEMMMKNRENLKTSLSTDLIRTFR